MFEPVRLTYLAGLLISLGGLGLLDWRNRIVLWQDARRALRALGLSWVLFAAWDLLGLGLKAYQLVPSRYTTHAAAFGLPVEEMLFLLLLCYLTLILWELHARSGRRHV